MLDIEERFHLALHAGSVGQHHACLTYLKEILQQEPRHAPAIYLLAVQHAELGLAERAIHGMKAALAIEPTIAIARFQLGLLLLDINRRAEAKESFAALSGSPDSALRMFCEAMMALADDDPGVARERLAAGLSEPSSNPALSAVMRRVLDGLLNKEGAAVGAPAADADQVFLGAYRRASS